MDSRILGLIYQYVFDMFGVFILFESFRAVIYQVLGIEFEDIEGSYYGFELLERQFWGELYQEGFFLKGFQGKERLGYKDVDEDRDIDEFLFQEFFFFQVFLSLQSFLI